MSFFVGYPKFDGVRGAYAADPSGWLLSSTGLHSERPAGDVFLIGCGLVPESCVLVGYFVIGGLVPTDAAPGVVASRWFSLPDLRLPMQVARSLPQVDNGERSIFQLDEDVGRQLLKIVQGHLDAIGSSVSLGKPRTKAVREKSPEEQAEAIESKAKGRLGQAGFRAKLIGAYKACPLTGCTIDEVLSAAHIWEYHQGGVHELWNGILLRADIHLLFDRHLLRIFPGDPPIIVLDDSIHGVPGYDFHLKPLTVPKGVDKDRMNEVLRERWNAANGGIEPFPEPKPEDVRKK